MKRSGSLARRSPLRRSRPAPRRDEDPTARAIWTEPHSGFCTCGCDPPTFSSHLERHHVVTKERLKVEGRQDVLWDLRNSMLLDPNHHARHTGAFKRIPLASVPAAAFEFAREVLGEGASEVYFDRFYAPWPDLRERRIAGAA